MVLNPLNIQWAGTNELRSTKPSPTSCNKNCKTDRSEVTAIDHWKTFNASGKISWYGSFMVTVHNKYTLARAASDVNAMCNDPILINEQRINTDIIKV